MESIIFYKVLFWMLLFIIVYVYFLYPVFLYIFSFFIQKELIKGNQEDKLPNVSIIMAAYNELKFIERKIKNCLSLDYPKNKIEIIIGSDASEDGTNNIIEKYVTEDSRVKFFPHTERRGKMAVVNDGVKNAIGEICVFSDVSELFDKDAVRKLVRNFKTPDVGAVTGNHLYNPSKANLGKGTILYWKYQRMMQKLESKLETILSCDGTIYACRRRLYVAPPEGTINDDKAVPLGVIRQGYRVVFEPEAIVRGDALNKTDSFFNQKVRSQAGMYQLIWRYLDMFWIKRPVVLFIFLSHMVGPVMVPWLLLVLLWTNLMILSVYPYNIVFFLQVIFYLSSLCGLIAQAKSIRTPIFYVPYFFVVSNVASLLGFFSYLLKIQKAEWTKVE